MSAPAEGAAWRVVVNGEQQHSLWPAHEAPPLGWAAVGEPASREACLAWIERHWSDMTPPSLRAARAARPQ